MTLDREALANIVADAIMEAPAPVTYRSAGRAVVEALAPHLVPAGYVAVPVGPTKDMLIAGCELDCTRIKCRMHNNCTWDEQRFARVEERYAAMVAAAKEPGR